MILVALAAVVAVGSASPTDELPTSDSQISSAGMALLGADEFDGPKGAPPNPRYWDYDVGGGGWGNNERQTYTKATRNARLDGDGGLTVEAHRDGDGFTSARLVTRGRVEFRFGLIEARIRMPEGQGIHPAFWLLGTDVQTSGWPESGEIDVMELVNTGSTYHNALHGPTVVNSDVEWKQSADGDAGTNLADDFHVYQIFRQPGAIKIGIDGRVVGSYRRDSMPAGANWVFDKPMYVLLNVAVGGDWPGPVAVDTSFPATMRVAWIRYWE